MNKTKKYKKKVKKYKLKKFSKRNFREKKFTKRKFSRKKSNKRKHIKKRFTKKKLTQKEFICPNDIKGVNSHKDAGAALSGILLKPYYSDSLIKDKYFNWDNISLRYAVLPKQKVNNPCNK